MGPHNAGATSGGASSTEGGAPADVDGTGGTSGSDASSGTSADSTAAPYDDEADRGGGTSAGGAAEADSDKLSNAAGEGGTSGGKGPGDDGRCGCKIAGSSRGTPPVGLMLVGLLALRRRPRV